MCVLYTVYVCIYVCVDACARLCMFSFFINVVYGYTTYALRLDTKWKNIIIACLFIGRLL